MNAAEDLIRARADASLPDLQGLGTALARYGVPRPVLDSALRRAETVAAMAPGEAARVVASSVFLGEGVAGAALEREWTAAEVDDLSLRAGGDDRSALEIRSLAFVAGLRSRLLFELPPRLAVTVQLRLLSAFARISEATAWLPGASTPFAVVGVEEPSRRARKLAVDTVATGSRVGQGNALLHGIPIFQWDNPTGALVVRVRADTRESALAHATETAFAVAPILEKESMLDNNALREDALVSVSERRLARLGFDLHDGPLQDIAALAFELRLFGHHLRTEHKPESPDRLAARADDFIARLAAIETDIRELAQSLESGRLLRGSLGEILRTEAARVAAGSSVDISVSVTGRTDDLTPSQRIALVRLVEGALENVKQHSNARAATVAVESGRSNVRVAVTDDGDGFDVETTLVEAARRGRLGLVGMGERIRLLGGRLDIASSDGGPTVIAATIPRWRPPAPSS